MQNRFQGIEELIQDYIDDRLDDEDRATFLAYLELNHELADEVEEMRKLNDMLKYVGREVFNEPVPKGMKKLLDDARRDENRRELDHQTKASSFFLDQF